MIAILGKGFISCLISSNNRNPQSLSFQKIYTLLGMKRVTVKQRLREIVIWGILIPYAENNVS